MTRKHQAVTMGQQLFNLTTQPRNWPNQKKKMWLPPVTHLEVAVQHVGAVEVKHGARNILGGVQHRRVVEATCVYNAALLKITTRFLPLTDSSSVHTRRRSRRCGRRVQGCWGTPSHSSWLVQWCKRAAMQSAGSHGFKVLMAIDVWMTGAVKTIMLLAWVVNDEHQSLTAHPLALLPFRPA